MFCEIKLRFIFGFAQITQIQIAKKCTKLFALHSQNMCWNSQQKSAKITLILSKKYGHIMETLLTGFIIFDNASN